jgi:5-methylcytosine-specific restriction endonuclease McrA
MLELYGTNCYLCDMPINLQVSGQPGSNPQWRSGLHIEHFVAITNGGSDTIENVRPSHAWCNLTKGSK